MYNGELNNIPDMNRKYFTKWHDNEFFLKLYLNDMFYAHVSNAIDNDITTCNKIHFML